MAELTLSDVARLVGGVLEGDGDRVIRGVAPLETAGEDDLSLVASRRYLPYVASTSASGVLIARGLGLEDRDDLPRVRVADPHAALALVLPTLYPEELPPPGVHPTAIIDASAELEDGVTIGPYAVIGRDVWVGARSRVGAHTVVDAECRIGAECVLHPHVTVYRAVVLGDRCTVHSGARLGAEGFGFVFRDGRHQKVPQVGGCRIGDDVEIGANTTLDRGSIGDTVVGSGTKIDNLVHVGHNVQVGRNVVIVAQVGVSGSVVIGDNVTLAGQAGIAGHLTIGDGATVGGQAGVFGDIPPGETVSGYPARPHREALRASAALFRLPHLLYRLRRLEQALAGGQRNADA